MLHRRRRHLANNSPTTESEFTSGDPAAPPSRSLSVTTPAFPPGQGRSWPYAVASVLVLAIQQGWDPAAVSSLAAVLLILIALLRSASHSDD
jgi:hypothetical protein